MTIKLLPSLIDKQDNFELIRDHIAALLFNEQANQVALATTAAKPSPDDWKLRIRLERSNPVSDWVNVEKVTDFSPIINIWVDNSAFDMRKSDPVKRQTATTIYNIDCYGIGIASDDGASGHNSGDEVSAKSCQAAVKFVRNILMEGLNTYLQLRGLVGIRWINSINFFQPTQNGTPVQHVQGGRIAFRVQYNEFSPQIVPVELELLTVEMSDENEVLLTVNYNYTT